MTRFEVEKVFPSPGNHHQTEQTEHVKRIFRLILAMDLPHYQKGKISKIKSDVVTLRSQKSLMRCIAIRPTLIFKGLLESILYEAKRIKVHSIIPCIHGTHLPVALVYGDFNLRPIKNSS